MKFRKKPVIIEAIQFSGYNPTEIKRFVGDACEVEYNDVAYQAEADPMTVRVFIHTLEGDMIVSPSDYVINGVKGEFYPCKPDIFEQTYEPIIEEL